MIPIDFGAMKTGNGAGELSYRVCKMACKKQLAILKQGFAVWNKWRKKHPNVKIDLRGAELNEQDLRRVNLSSTDFTGAKFVGYCNFVDSDLTGSTFKGVFIDESTRFHQANLSYTSWRNISINVDSIYKKYSHNTENFYEMGLCGEHELKIFKWVKETFKETLLSDYDVFMLLVHGGCCNKILSLKGKNLKATRLVNFDLRGVDLRETNLLQANLSGADITGAKLYGSARENWIIDGIRCDYIYWDEAGEQRTPPDRDFRPGEFEELYKQLPTFEYIFEQGFTPLDPLIMDRVVQAVNERHKEFSLELVNFDKRGQPHATFTVCHLEHVEKAKQQIAVGYEESRIAPEQQVQLMDIISKLLDHNTLLVGNQSKSLDIIKQLGESAMGDIYNISGGQIGAVGQSASASGNTFQQITADLSRLHEEMQRSAKTPEQRAAAEDVAKAAQAAREKDEPAMLQHLKTAGRFALDCAQKIGAEALAEYLKKMTLGM